ncbi:MAG: hypothetical protein HQL50_12345, partial [Magnetococcales bacterium]|nr:hypothetical protein [Magnetococcales bacterium]
ENRMTRSPRNVSASAVGGAVLLAVPLLFLPTLAHAGPLVDAIQSSLTTVAVTLAQVGAILIGMYAAVASVRWIIYQIAYGPHGFMELVEDDYSFFIKNDSTQNFQVDAELRRIEREQEREMERRYQERQKVLDAKVKRWDTALPKETEKKKQDAPSDIERNPYEDDPGYWDSLDREYGDEEERHYY